MYIRSHKHQLHRVSHSCCGQAEEERPPAPAKGHTHLIAATPPRRRKTAWLSAPGAAAGCAGARLPTAPGEHGSYRVTVRLGRERTTPPGCSTTARLVWRHREFSAQPSDNFSSKYVSKERTSVETAPPVMPSPPAAMTLDVSPQSSIYRTPACF